MLGPEQPLTVLVVHLVLLIDETSWDETVLAAGFVDMLLEKDHVVEIILDEVFFLVLVGITVLVHISFEGRFSHLQMVLFSFKDVIGIAFGLPSHMLQVKFGLRDELLADEPIIDPSSILRDHQDETFEGVRKRTE